MIKTGILTISDKGSQGQRRDESGPAIRESLGEADFQVTGYEVVPDEAEVIARKLAEWADGGLDLTATRTNNEMCQSYLSLFGRRDGSEQSGPVLVSVSNRFDGAAVSQPKQFGSHKSRLIQVLLDDKLHRQEVHLSRQQWLALVTWVDLNAPYYDRFYNRRPQDGGEPRRDILIQFPAPFATASPKTRR